MPEVDQEHEPSPIDEAATPRRKFALALIALPVAAALIHCVLYPEGDIDIDRWLGFIRMNRQMLEAILGIITILGILLLVAEFVCGRETVANALAWSATYVERGAPIISKAAVQAQRHMYRTVVPTAKSSGSPWWEDGPVYGLFFWLAWGPAQLEPMLTRAYGYMIDEYLYAFPLPSAESFVGIPFLISELAMAYFLLVWLWRCTRIVIIFISTIFHVSDLGYWNSCKRKLHDVNERFEHSLFDNTMGGSTESRIRLRPRSASEYFQFYVLGSLFLLAFCWLIWPALLYLLILSLAFWFISELLKLSATLSVIGVRFSRLPRVGPALALLGAGFEYCLRLH